MSGTYLASKAPSEYIYPTGSPTEFAGTDLSFAPTNLFDNYYNDVSIDPPIDLESLPTTKFYAVSGRWSTNSSSVANRTAFFSNVQGIRRVISNLEASNFCLKCVTSATHIQFDLNLDLDLDCDRPASGRNHRSDMRHMHSILFRNGLFPTEDDAKS
jgi:hypothetical protein